MKTKREFLEPIKHYIIAFKGNGGTLVENAMEQYSEQNSDFIHDIFNNPCKELKPLEDLWRKENPRDNFTIPDRTAFYRWIRLKILPK